MDVIEELDIEEVFQLEDKKLRLMLEQEKVLRRLWQTRRNSKEGILMAQKVKKTRRRKERKNVEHGAAHINQLSIIQ